MVIRKLEQKGFAKKEEEELEEGKKSKKKSLGKKIAIGAGITAAALYGGAKLLQKKGSEKIEKNIANGVLGDAETRKKAAEESDKLVKVIKGSRKITEPIEEGAKVIKKGAKKGIEFAAEVSKKATEATKKGAKKGAEFVAEKAKSGMEIAKKGAKSVKEGAKKLVDKLEDKAPTSIKAKKAGKYNINLIKKSLEKSSKQVDKE